MAPSWRRWYDAWAADYQAYARRRGFQTFNDWPYHRRGFIECWAQPGFHRFWQVWNPGIAYFVHRLYLALGGRRRWALPTILSFAICGFVHTLLMAPFYRRWSHTLVGAFTCFGVLTVASRYLAPLLRQDRWPTVANIALNVVLVIASFDLGFRLDRIL
ncbi:MAG: hypothetical protein ACYTAS_02170 [Planctomycetota bacterium]|jgi:hypothetical protein